jgi:hypothetical protein
MLSVGKLNFIPSGNNGQVSMIVCSQMTGTQKNDTTFF